MHLGIVGPGIAEYFDYLAYGIFYIGGPRNYLDKHFLSVLGPVQLIHRHIYVVCENPVIHNHERHVVVYAQHPDKRFAGAFDYFYHFALALASAPGSVYDRSNRVALDGPFKITLGHKNLIAAVFGNDMRFAIAVTVDYSDNVVAFYDIHVFGASVFFNCPGAFQFRHCLFYQFFVNLFRQAGGCRQLFVIERAASELRCRFRQHLLDVLFQIFHCFRFYHSCMFPIISTATMSCEPTDFLYLVVRLVHGLEFFGS